MIHPMYMRKIRPMYFTDWYRTNTNLYNRWKTRVFDLYMRLLFTLLVIFIFFIDRRVRQSVHAG